MDSPLTIMLVLERDYVKHFQKKLVKLCIFKCNDYFDLCAIIIWNKRETENVTMYFKNVP